MTGSWTTTGGTTGTAGGTTTTGGAPVGVLPVIAARKDLNLLHETAFGRRRCGEDGAGGSLARCGCENQAGDDRHDGNETMTHVTLRLFRFYPCVNNKPKRIAAR